MYCIRKQLISSTVFRVLLLFAYSHTNYWLLVSATFDIGDFLLFFFFFIKMKSVFALVLFLFFSFIHIFVVWFWSNLLPYSGGLCYVPFARSHFLPTFFNNWQKICMNSKREAKKKNLKLEIYFHSTVFAL